MSENIQSKKKKKQTKYKRKKSSNSAWYNDNELTMGMSKENRIWRAKRIKRYNQRVWKGWH
ncbi:hypothetical protein A2U94_14425 [Bacillus sp. VT 712]|uniref:hypothetical protein n=1 Tax=Bacillaceae TaxID=186817 RepID=UPI0007A50BC5|nr:MULTISPECIES: hypothetical protein [Bacillaceae]KZB90779.1 hypothetical protein A2U94_14425 [Bacillus sp. VT 712]